MDYRLIVLTHGPKDDLRRSLDSFSEMVRPFPADAVLLVDGKAGLGYLDLLVSTVGPQEASVFESGGGAGFCAQVARGWELAALAPAPYVFWLEHDFIFNRRVDLADLAAVLEAEPNLAQMALMRQPVSEAEIAAGALVASRPGQFARRATAGHVWLEEREFFTTNPSLMRRAFVVENPWPDYDARCEGRFGLDLIARGYSFGFWGAGEEWVRHTGVRSGRGY